MCRHKYKIIETYKFDNELIMFGSTRMDGHLAQDLARRGIIVSCNVKSVIK